VDIPNWPLPSRVAAVFLCQEDAGIGCAMNSAAASCVGGISMMKSRSEQTEHLNF
jgi:hypothetical protein